MTTEKTQPHLARLEEKLDQLIRMTEENIHNTAVVYRRTTALAQMVEALAEGREPRLTRNMRAEIDASLHGEEFAQMMQSDPEAFIRLYGKEVYELCRDRGKGGILTMGNLAPSRGELKKKMQ